MSNKSLTLVLPVYNAEAHLRKSVSELLEVASGLSDKFIVLVIDDGSTDATFEVASELAADYPQVSLVRHRARRGLGAAFAYVERRVRSDAIFIHDGVTPIDAEQLRRAWREWLSRQGGTPADAAGSVQLEDVASLPQLHAAMEEAHRRVLGFQPFAPCGGIPAAVEPISAIERRDRPDAGHLIAAPDVGRIPRLPRPKFLTALKDFAWGE